MPASARRHAMLAGALLCLAGAQAAAQTDLGAQRVGTSSGTFLKIPIGARESALAGALNANVSGPGAMFINPAGLGLEGEKAVQVSAISYVTGIPAGGAALCMAWAAIRGSVGFAFSGLFAEMDETTEYHPLGTGRTFSYSSWVASLGASRALTDKLSFGLALKLFHEGLGTEVGGPSLTPWMVDAGAIYYVGYRDARIGIAVSNFGPDLRPGGEYTSRRTGSDIRYGSFSPPTVFRFGFSVDPYRSDDVAALLSIDIGHMADHRESVRMGLETGLRETLLLRAGYDFTADALKFHTGLGVRIGIGEQVLTFDYAYSDGGEFGNVHRWTLTTPW